MSVIGLLQHLLFLGRIGGILKVSKAQNLGEGLSGGRSRLLMEGERKTADEKKYVAASTSYCCWKRTVKRTVKGPVRVHFTDYTQKPRIPSANRVDVGYIYTHDAIRYRYCYNTCLNLTEYDG